MKSDKDLKQLKKNALMSFLETSATPSVASQVSKEPESKISATQQDAFQQYVEELNACNVCGTELDAEKKKKCQFCSMPACNDHIRKRRKKKSKWERICDNCEDRYIYDVYMKLQSKAEEALAVQQQIITLKHENFLKEVETRREKRREIGFKTMSLQQHYEQQITKISDAENKLISLEHQVQSTQLSVEQLQAFVERASAAFKENNEQSFNILTEENARMGKQLTKLEKKVIEIKTSIEKKEKEIEDAFNAWQQRQFKKKLESQERAAAKKKQGCEIF